MNRNAILEALDNLIEGAENLWREQMEEIDDMQDTGAHVGIVKYELQKNDRLLGAIDNLKRARGLISG